MLLFLALFSWASADEPDLSATADQIEAVAEEAPVSAGEAPAVVGDETNAPEEVADESASEETVVELPPEEGVAAEVVNEAPTDASVDEGTSQSKESNTADQTPAPEEAATESVTPEVAAAAENGCPWLDSRTLEVGGTLATVDINGVSYNVRGSVARDAFAETLASCGAGDVTASFESWRKWRRLFNYSLVTVPVFWGVPSALAGGLVSHARSTFEDALKSHPIPRSGETTLAVEEIAVGEVVEVPADPEADRALLDALLLLNAYESGALGARSLGALEDERAIIPLVHTAETRSTEVATAAAQALGNYPEAVPVLARWVREGWSVASSVENEAARALGRIGDPAGGDALVDALNKRKLSSDQKVVFHEVVQQSFPDRTDEVLRFVAEDGTPWLIAAGAHGLGLGLGAAGYFGQADLQGLGVATGVLGGATWGYFGGRANPIEAADASFIATTGIVGSTGISLLATGVFGNDEESAFWVSSAVGELLTYRLGFSLYDKHAGSTVDVLEGVALSQLAALGFGHLGFFIDEQSRASSQSDVDPILVSTGLGMMVGLGVGHAVMPRVDVTAEDYGLIALGGGYGVLAGLLLPIEDDPVDGLPGMLGATGAISTMLLSERLNFGTDVNGAALAGLGYGGFAGFGLANLVVPYSSCLENQKAGWNCDLSASRADSLHRSTTLLAATGGMAVGGFLAHQNPNGLEDDDALISAAGAGVTLWQSLGWGEVLDVDSRLYGLNMLLPSLVGGGLAVASPYLDVSEGESLSALSLGLWGTYTGAVVGYLSSSNRGSDDVVTVNSAGNSNDTGSGSGEDTSTVMLRASLIGSDLGLIGGVVLMSPLVGLDPVVVGIANAGGVVGASVASLATSFVTDEADPILVGSLVGAGLGAVGGYRLGQRYAERIEEREARSGRGGFLDFASNWQISPTSFVDEETGVMYGALLSHRGW